MKSVKTKILLTIETPKVTPLATDIIEKRIAILKNSKGDFVSLKPHQLKRDLITFLEKSGLTFEYSKTQGRRGKVEIAGVSVKVSAINHTNYDNGVYIKIDEENNISLKNTVKVLKYLTKNGIDVDRECSATDNGTSCLTKLSTELKA